MPKLLIVTTIPETLESFLLPFARHYRALGWQVDALAGGAFDFPWRTTHFDQTFTVRWSRSPLDPGNLLGTPGQIRALLQRERYDIVHVHTPVAAFVTRVVAGTLPAAQRPRMIYTAHGFHFHPYGSALKNAVFIALEWFAGRFTDDLVVMNRADEAGARRFRLQPQGRVHRMPGIGVDLRQYSTQAVSAASLRASREAWGVGDAPYLLCVAEFIARKRHPDLLRAFAQVQRERPDVFLLLAGTGRLEAELRHLCVQLGIIHRVRFLGFRRDIPALLRGAQAIVLTSEQEGLPRCLLEAMSVGTPVVATDIRGVRDLLEGDLGLLVPLGDVPALAEAMNDVLARPGAAQQRALQAAEAIKQYDVTRIIEQHDQLYALGLGRDLAGH